MAGYCNNCGAAIDEGVNYCPNCGASVNGYSNTANQTGAVGYNSGMSGAARTAAMVGGAAIGASALTGLARRMTHRRRPPYMPPMGGPPPMGGHGGPGGPGRGF